MILLDLGQQKDWEYDVRALVSSFYPGEEIVLEAPADGAPEDLRRIRVRDRIPAGCTDKNVMKRALYASLAEETGKRLPWGMLTGIRPTKLTMNFLEEGLSPEEAAARMRESYLVSAEKARLAAEISGRELAAVSGLAAGGWSLYLGIPFCPTTCLYCSFTSYPLAAWAARTDEYLDALERELAWTAQRFSGHPCHTVYIGGGTPTSISEAQLDRLLSAVEARVPMETVREFTVEAGRPDSITEGKLRVLRAHPVTRISINPQTMRDETLRLIGRHHTAADTVRAFETARRLGFDDINMDLIIGLPGEKPADVTETMRQIEALRPENLTVHSLAVKRASRLKMEAHGAVRPELTEAEYGEMMALAQASAARMGLSPYYLYRQKNMVGNLENVGFCAPGKEGLYNILIMEELEHIAALGAGTVSKAVYPDGRIERADNVKDVGLYLSRTDEMIRRKERLFRDI